MDFERGQIGNFLKQVQRIKNQEKLMKNKNGKGGIFVEPAKHLMAALGKNAFMSNFSFSMLNRWQ